MSDFEPCPFSASGARFPGRAPIDAYGNGGFRFADMSHRGSILCLPEGVFAWDASGPEDLDLDRLGPVIEALSAPAFLLLGTGRTQVFPPLEMQQWVVNIAIWVAVAITVVSGWQYVRDGGNAS